MRDSLSKMMRNDRGAVSIFIVIFASILMAVISVSFVLLMLRSQQQATNTELSQTAYDAATTGVEDGKGALAQCLQVPSTTGCSEISTANDDCQILTKIFPTRLPLQTDGTYGQEYPLQGTEGSNSLNQAYTCVTINNQPSTYQADLSSNSSFVLPLTATANSSTLTFSWKANPSHVFASLPTATTNLLDQPTWAGAQQYPPLMRLQLIRGVVSADDSTGGSTLFVYPSNISGSQTADFSTDPGSPRTTTGINPNKPVLTSCAADTCTVTLKDGAGSVVQPGNYLVITPIYQNASIKLAFPSSSPDTFVNLQAVIDSTGRANNLFRRVQARVDLIPHPVYPNATLSLQGPLCKNFVVTPTQYVPTYASPGCAAN